MLYCSYRLSLTGRDKFFFLSKTNHHCYCYLAHKCEFTWSCSDQFLSKQEKRSFKIEMVRSASLVRSAYGLMPRVFLYVYNFFLLIYICVCIHAVESNYGSSCRFLNSTVICIACFPFAQFFLFTHGSLRFRNACSLDRSIHWSYLWLAHLIVCLICFRYDHELHSTHINIITYEYQILNVKFLIRLRDFSMNEMNNPEYC